PQRIRYTMSDEKILNISLVNAVYGEEQEAMLNILEKTPGVHGVTPELSVDKKLARLSIRIDKDLVLSTILDVLAEYRLQIEGITTQEPTFEDAFTAITRKREKK
ncbi:MAG: hypothetical protein JSU79_06150, partial [Dehalococcoidales bacterium]